MRQRKGPNYYHPLRPDTFSVILCAYFVVNRKIILWPFHSE